VGKIERVEILPLDDYEEIRARFRTRVVREKRVRRIHLGPHISAVFENRDSVLLQIQEMLRTERIVKEEGIAHEVATYNELLPAADELSLTLFVEIAEKDVRERVLVELAGLEEQVFVTVDAQDVCGTGQRSAPEVPARGFAHSEGAGIARRRLGLRRRVFVYERPIRFEEVDAAGIVFFGCYARYAHEAMEAFFAELDGGYPHLITGRKVGLPAVHVEMKFKAPARYGDVLRVETTVARLGNRSAVLRYQMRFASRAKGTPLGDDTSVAEVLHTVVTTDLAALKSCEMPSDVRDALSSHLEASSTSEESASKESARPKEQSS